jgi:hypothetical protein
MPQLEIAEGLVRIRVPLERGPGEGGPADDWIWAEPLGSGRYRIESCPFFAYGLSRDDVVAAPGGARRGDDAPSIDGVVEKGGHRTLRLALSASAELSTPGVRAVLEHLLQLGCTHEALRPKIVAIDVPPQVDVASVAERLQQAARDGLVVWEWADPRPC